MKLFLFGFDALAVLLVTGLPVIAGDARVPWTANRIVGSPHPPPPYALERVFTNVTFNQPVDLAFLPGAHQLAVAEQSGRILSFDVRTNNAQPTLALDWRRHHRPLDNILGFAFHPGFATNRHIFINYNEPGGRENGSFVSRFTMASVDPPLIDPASERVFLRWLSGGHNGCTLAFGNDGLLYVSTGDGANPDPPDMPYQTGQHLGDLLASILRIDVNRGEGTNAYAIPPDNPFVATPGARPEIWAFGFRNPFRMSFDRQTGQLWVGDVGWEQWEMIHLVRRGGNYGWPINEGPNLNVRTDVKPGPGPILPPLVSLPHTEAASITGGVVYRGRRLPKLRGAYLYGDWETGKFWALRHDGDRLLSNDELCDTALKPVAFTLDPSGELLILDYNGGLYQFVPNAAPPSNQSFPRRLSDTGLFTAMNPAVLAPGVVPYRIHAPMWNDYAAAEWLLGVPGTNAIASEGGVGNIAGGTWSFPSNTVLARTLTLEMEAGKPVSRRRIETQVLHWDGQAWNPHTYRWNVAQTDADLVPGHGTNVLFTVTDAAAPGGRREIPWRFASRAECLRCHNAWAGEALTLNWMQLGLPASRRSRDGSGNEVPKEPTELQRLQSLGVLRVRRPPNPTPVLANPYDAARPLDARARSWLHVNCATCHRFGAGGAALAHLNLDKPIRDLRALDERPVRGDFGLPDARIIAPGDPFASVLMWRTSTEGAGHMPVVGARLVDPVGMQLVHDWIRSLPPSSTNARAPFSAAATPAATLLADSRSALALAYQATFDPPAKRDEVAAAANRSTNALIRDLFQRLLPSGQRRPTLGADFEPGTVLALHGDTARGREIFIGAAQCARCHVCGGEGRAFGPELAGLARKYSRAQLLDEIRFPSRTIAPEFKLTTITLRDDTELSGFVVRRSAREWVLRDETLVERPAKLAEVKETRESLLSAMPEGLLAPLTAQETADLVEYLHQQ